MKDHEIAQLVNQLRDIAVEFHGHQSLRDRIARVVVPVVKGQDSAVSRLISSKPDVAVAIDVLDEAKLLLSQGHTFVALKLLRDVIAGLDEGREAEQRERNLDALDKALEEGIETGLMLGKQKGN